MQRFLIITGLQMYALALAALQMGNGIRTDEAKYLLNIPYPHPPLARFILSLTESWSMQELFWRIMFATALVQAVWFVHAMTRQLSSSARLTVMGGWLCSAAVLFQAGTIMMAPLTALQAFVFLWLYVREKSLLPEHAGWVALLWIASLFTAFQAALFLPLAWAVLRRTGKPLWVVFVLWLSPLILLGLYTLSNPLAFASMFVHVGSSAHILERMREALFVLGVGGSVVLCITGIGGAVMAKRWSLLWALLLVIGYIPLTPHGYYAILCTPLFIVGTVLFLERVRMPSIPLQLGIATSTIFFLLLRPPLGSIDSAKEVMGVIQSHASNGPVLINGSFGHEWQYRSNVSVLRYNPSLAQGAQAVVCISACPAMLREPEFIALRGLPMDVWVRQ